MSPETFEQALKHYDPALTVRWGHVIKAWVVDRKCRIPAALLLTLTRGMKKAVDLLGKHGLSPERIYPLQKVCEEGYSAGFGCRVIIYAKYLDNRVFDALRLTDLQAAGNLERAINASVNRADQKKRDRYNEFEPLGREVVDVMGWANRRHSTEVDHGKSPQLMAEAFKKEAPKGTKQHFTSLLDAQGVPTKQKREVRLELATR